LDCGSDLVAGESHRTTEYAFTYWRHLAAPL
jgi:hypothetical protein